MRRDDVRFSTYNRFCQVGFKVPIMVLDNQLTNLSVINVMDMELTARLYKQCICNGDYWNHNL